MTAYPDTQCGRVLAVLADGRPHTVPDIHRRAGTMRLNSRVAELRKRGHDIVCERVKHRKGPGAYRYTWLNAPPATATATSEIWLDGNDVAPRTPAERFRVYRVRRGQLELVCTAASPEAVGVALCALGAEGEFDHSCVGILDTHGTDDKPGTWLLNPWDPTAYGA